MPPVQRGDGIRAVPGHAGDVLRVALPELRRDRGSGRRPKPGRGGEAAAEEAGRRVTVRRPALRRGDPQLTPFRVLCYRGEYFSGVGGEGKGAEKVRLLVPFRGRRTGPRVPDRTWGPRGGRRRGLPPRSPSPPL